MSTEQPRIEPYSAEVRMSLEVRGCKYNVANAGPSRIVVREPVDVEPCDAVLAITVDGQTSRMNIRLPNGAVPFDREIAIEVVREPCAAAT